MSLSQGGRTDSPRLASYMEAGQETASEAGLWSGSPELGGEFSHDFIFLGGRYNEGAPARKRGRLILSKLISEPHQVTLPCTRYQV